MNWQGYLTLRAEDSLHTSITTGIVLHMGKPHAGRGAKY